MKNEHRGREAPNTTTTTIQSYQLKSYSIGALHFDEMISKNVEHGSSTS
jgi:hypothetical protein